ncbi:MAG: Tm-1-like ATP-binding domain-containing protein [Chloroflexota bacterium]
MATVVLVGALDTKGLEYAWLRERLLGHGVEVILIDAGVLGAPLAVPDITRQEVARAAGADLADLAAAGDRGEAIAAMSRGAAAVVRRWHDEGRLDAVAGLGGGGGSALISEAMRALPLGVPKLLVSTVAAGDTRPYVGMSDLTLMHSVVDIAGVNRISEPILANAAAAVAGMARGMARGMAWARTAFAPAPAARPLIAATMFGVTTPCVTAARERLEDLGYEVVVFHATGTGGAAMERLIGEGFFAGVLDVTTTELADELVGGVMSAGPDRLTAAGAMGVPQVVSVGAVDMVNFGPAESVPERFRGRRLHRHNQAVTLMRTTPEECADIGRRIADRLAPARGPVALFVPLGGVSAIAGVGGVFHDPEADLALAGALRERLRDPVRAEFSDAAINDPAFAVAMADALHAMIAERAAPESGRE